MIVFTSVDDDSDNKNLLLSSHKQLYCTVWVERLVAEGSVETSELSQVIAALKADNDRDVRYFVERVTLSVTSSSDCEDQ